MMSGRGLVLVVCGACGSSAPAGADTSSSDVATTTTSSSGTSDATSTSGGDCMPTNQPPPGMPKSCALATIDPDVDPTMVIDAGDGVGQIPTVVGDVLLRNCGCHYNTNTLMPGSGYIDYLSDAQPMATWADFHVNFTGTFPVGYEEMPAYLAIERRVVCSDPLPMPPFGCGAQDEDAMIGAADLALLTDWLAADAPDGASYPGG